MRAAFRGGRVPARLARSRRGRVDEIDGSVAQASQCCWPLTVTRYRYATRPPRRSRLYPSTDSGTIAKMDARSEPGLNDPFEEAIDDALSSLPGRSPCGDEQRRDRRRGRASRRAAAARPVPRRTAAAKKQHLQRSASRQDQHLRRADHATRCRRLVAQSYNHSGAKSVI